MISDINRSLGGLLAWAMVQFAIIQACYLHKYEALPQKLSSYFKLG
jgi:hypothetical protein